ncbi:hypothetical protein Ndes2526B_g04229 [Nannochloris sp. 'desiccata']|nr:hypothetical protein KSW81_001000 [Chlorella desiccata (nom. nud.)]KAH7620310.1 putative Dehydrogenase/reductase SDR family member 12 [Chlorella desiccata (nom. nud.)]
MFRLPFFIYVGLKNFTRGGYEKAAASFDASLTKRDLKGVSAMVTGANQGIGYQASLDLASRGSTLYMICRNETRGKEAVEKVKQETGNTDVHLRLCDLSSLSSIFTFAKDFEASGKPLHLLVNNAGLMVHEGERSVDNYEMNFAVNTLGNYAITRALEPVLKRTAATASAATSGSKNPPAVRVIFVASGGALTEHLEIDDLEGTKIAQKKDFGTIQYARDKRRQLAITEQLAKEWTNTAAPAAAVHVFAMHPGWTSTEGVKTSIPDFYARLKDKLRTLPQGADTILYLCLESIEKLKSGEFYLDRKVQSKHLPLAGTRYSEEEAKKLTAVLDGLISKAKLSS